MLAVLLSFALLIAVLCLIGYVVHSSHQKRRRAWTHVASQLGLRLLGDSLSGLVRGHHILVRLVSRGAGKNQRTFTVVQSELWPPLDLGLGLRRHNVLANLFRPRDIQLGDPTFDATFIISGDDDDRVRRFLTPPLRQALLKLGGATFSLHDGGIAIECDGATSNEAWLVWAIEGCASIAHEMEQGRQQTPPAAALLAHPPIWSQYATAAGLYGQNTPLSLTGTLGSHKVLAFARRVGPHQYTLVVHIRFARPLGLGLLVQERGSFNALTRLLSRPDQRSDDPAFDAQFRVHARDRQALASLLDTEARQQLLTLRAQIGVPRLDDSGLSVQLSSLPPPELVPQIIDQVVNVATQLTAPKQGIAAAPYR